MAVRRSVYVPVVGKVAVVESVDVFENVTPDGPENTDHA